MRTKIFAAALVASSALAAPAFAQDADPTFTGPRVEALVGWDRVEDGSGVGSTDGLGYGAAIGYDHQIGSTAVLGIEGEVMGSTAKDTVNGAFVPNDRLRASAGRDFYVGARLGFRAGDRTLIYAKGGYTNAQFRTRYDNGNTTTITRDNADGWRLGAGAEVNLTGDTYAKAEYRYSKYDDNSAGINAKRHQVLAGVGVRF